MLPTKIIGGKEGVIAIHALFCPDMPGQIYDHSFLSPNDLEGIGQVREYWTSMALRVNPSDV